MDSSGDAPASPRVTADTGAPVDPTEGSALPSSRGRGRGRGRGRTVRQTRRAASSESSAVPTEVLSGILASLQGIQSFMVDFVRDQGRGQARVYALTRHDAQASNTMSTSNVVE